MLLYTDSQDVYSKNI